jgi:hypothetical protein
VNNAEVGNKIKVSIWTEDQQNIDSTAGSLHSSTRQRTSKKLELMCKVTFKLDRYAGIQDNNLSILQRSIDPEADYAQAMEQMQSEISLDNVSLSMTRMICQQLEGDLKLNVEKVD